MIKQYISKDHFDKTIGTKTCMNWFHDLTFNQELTNKMEIRISFSKYLVSIYCLIMPVSSSLSIYLDIQYKCESGSGTVQVELVTAISAIFVQNVAIQIVPFFHSQILHAFYHPLQWNLSKADTYEVEVFVRFREVSALGRFELKSSQI